MSELARERVGLGAAAVCELTTNLKCPISVIARVRNTENCANRKGKIWNLSREPCQNLAMDMNCLSPVSNETFLHSVLELIKKNWVNKLSQNEQHTRLMLFVFFPYIK